MNGYYPNKSPGWSMFASKRLIMRAIRVLGGGDREKARKALGSVRPDTMYRWEKGILRIGPDYRIYIEQRIKEKLDAGK
jgi:hypothetical protein